MRRYVSALATACLLTGSLNVLTACRQQEESAEKPAVEFPGRKRQAQDRALYQTRTRGGKEITFFSADFSGVERPRGLLDFTQSFHLPPVRQGNTGTCWSYATTSLLEAELRRLGKSEAKLSEMFTVYWEYVEKARRFIREKGNSALGEGSEHLAVIERMKQYGAVRAADYTGLLRGQTEHDHSALFKDFSAYLRSLQDKADWNEDRALAGVKKILDKHLGRPPDTIALANKTMTPKEYLDQELGLRLEDYVAFISFRYLPFYTKGEFRVPDNWWHSEEYYNIPLEEFYQAVLGAIKKGFTIALGGDFSEAGYSGEDSLAIVPTFDLPPSLIDQDSREFRFANRTTTDDHLNHVVGYKETGDHTWFLVKDSWETAYWGKFPGYFFYRDDYVKLKILTFLVHRDAVAELMQKFPGRS